MNEPSVAIAILNWNGRHFLKTLLPSLLHLSYPDYTVYIIDNNSSDGSVSFVNTSFPLVKTIVLDDNYGFALGYNKGLWGLKEDYYLMMNSDVEVPQNFLEPMVQMMQSDDKIAIVQPKILSLTNKHLFEHAGAAGGAIDILGYPFCRGRIFDRVEEDKGQYDDAKEIFWASGSCCLIRKKAYWQIGGMYGFYFMHMEEIDMCWRAHSAGYKVMYCPQSFIYHLGGGSLSYQSPRKTYLNFRNNIIMCWRNSPWYVNMWLLPLRFIMDGLAAVQFVMKRQNDNAFAVFKAYFEFLKWMLSDEKDSPKKKLSLRKAPGVFKGSIVWKYYVRKKKTWSDL